MTFPVSKRHSQGRPGCRRPGQADSRIEGKLVWRQKLTQEERLEACRVDRSGPCLYVSKQQR